MALLSKLLIIPLLWVGVKSAWAIDQDSALSMRYEPQAQRVELEIPLNLLTHRLPDIPSFFDQRHEEDQKLRLSAKLPEVSSRNAQLGASDGGAFIFSGLSWLTDRLKPGSSLRLEVPVTHRALSTAELSDEQLSSNYYSATYRLPEDLERVNIFFGPYSITKREIRITGKPIELRTYFSPGNQRLAVPYLDALENHIRRYSQQIGTYPYNQFSVVSAPIPVGYGLDRVTYISEQILGHGYMLGRSLAHEVLHSWWGSGVRVDYNEGNWAEGLTTYLADYQLAEDSSVGMAMDMRRDWLAAIGDARVLQTLKDFRSSAHTGEQAVGYGMSAMLFHMLRQRLGDGVFETGLQNFWRKNRDRDAGWADLQKAFEAASGEELGGYFDSWLNTTELPYLSVDVTGDWSESGRYRLEVNVSQRRKSSDPVAVLHVPVQIDQGENVSTHWLELSSDNAGMVIELERAPLEVAVDPYFDILRALTEGEQPLVLRSLGRVTQPVLMADAAFQTLGERLFKRASRTLAPLKITTLEAPLPPADVLVGVGSTVEINALYRRYFAKNLPKVATQGRSRAWVEKDGKGRLWLFISADDPASLDEDMRYLGYYAGQSYLSVAEGEQPIFGRWPALVSELRWRPE